MQWLSQFWESLTWSGVVFGILLLILQVIISYAAIILVMIKLPADYFSSSYAKNLKTDSPFLIRWGGGNLEKSDWRFFDYCRNRHDCHSRSRRTNDSFRVNYDGYSRQATT